MDDKKNIIVYTAQGCGPCITLKLFLAKHLIHYEPRGPEDAIAAGFRSVPVVVVGDEVIHGFDEKRLKEVLLNE